MLITIKRTINRPKKTKMEQAKQPQFKLLEKLDIDTKAFAISPDGTKIVAID